MSYDAGPDASNNGIDQSRRSSVLNVPSGLYGGPVMPGVRLPAGWRRGLQMIKPLYWAVALTAVIAPGLHLLSDVLEWVNGGFSFFQLLVNYLGFLPMPFLMLGLYAVQFPRIGWVGLIGTLLYSIAFIYFTHTTLYSIEESIPDYETLWRRLGGVYTLHGGLMIVGGIFFGVASLKARVLWRAAVVVFLVGIGLNLVVGLMPVPELIQTVGSTVRNLGLVGVGIGMLRTLIRPLQGAT